MNLKFLISGLTMIRSCYLINASYENKFCIFGRDRYQEGYHIIMYRHHFLYDNSIDFWGAIFNLFNVKDIPEPEDNLEEEGRTFLVNSIQTLNTTVMNLISITEILKYGGARSYDFYERHEIDHCKVAYDDKFAIMGKHPKLKTTTS